jgi:exonuclease SbcD
MADSLRLLHFADLHLGVQSGGRIDPATGLNQRVVDVCARFDALCEAAEAEQVHAVLFAGDAFNNQHPNPTLQSLFASRIRRLARAQIAVFLLIGNHDLPKAPGARHPFNIYDELEVERVVVGDDARVYQVPLREGSPAPFLQIAALPHFSFQHARATWGDDVDIDAVVGQRIAKLGSEIDGSLPSVFVGHCHVNTGDMGGSRDRYDVSEIQVLLSTFSGAPFAYIGLGHLHKAQVLSNDPYVVYPGSLERVDFGEGERITVAADGAVRKKQAEPKGFYRFDLNGPDWQVSEAPRFEEIAARRFVTIALDALDAGDPTDDLAARVAKGREAAGDLRDAFVRITASLGSPDRGRVTNTLARQLVPEAYDVRLALETKASTTTRDPRFAEPMSEGDALARFLESKDDWDDRPEILRLGRELIAEVLEA